MNVLFNPDATNRPKRTIHEQISAVDREIAMREAVYAKQVLTGKLTRIRADQMIADMVAVRDTLVWVRDNELLIREVHRMQKSKQKEALL